MSEREAAQKAYQDLQKSKNPSAFDAMGSFNRYYAGWNVNMTNSLAMDVGKSIPAKDRATAIESFNKYLGKSTVPVPTPTQPEEQGFFSRAFEKVEKAYNFTTQAVSFGLTLPEKSNPIWQGDFSLDSVKTAWDQSRDISAGRSIMRTWLEDHLIHLKMHLAG
jgi:hypothetical protein